MAEKWARLQAELHKNRLKLAVVDSLLAATARRYQLTVATNNLRGFKAAGVPVLNPSTSNCYGFPVFTMSLLLMVRVGRCPEQLRRSGIFVEQ